jgi:hypothetical protein
MKSYFFSIVLIVTSVLSLYAQEHEEEEGSTTVSYIPEEAPVGNVLINIKDKDTDIIVDTFVAPWSFINASRTLKGLMENMGIHETPGITATFDLYSDVISPTALQFFNYILERDAGNDWESFTHSFVNESNMHDTIEVLRAVDFIQNEFLLEIVVVSLKDKLIKLGQNNRWYDVRDAILQLHNLGLAPHLANVLVNYLCNESLYIKNVLPYLKVKSKSVVLKQYKSSIFDAKRKWLAACIENRKVSIYALAPDNIPALLFTMRVDRGSPKVAIAQNKALMALVVDSDDSQILKLYSTASLLNSEPASSELSSSQPVLLHELPMGRFIIEKVLFSPDEKFILIIQRDIGITVFAWLVKIDIETLKQEVIKEKTVLDIKHIAISPLNEDFWAFSKRASFFKPFDKIVFYNFQDKNEFTIRMDRNNRIVVGLVFSPDGKKLAAAIENGFIKVWDVDTHKELYSLRGDTKDFGKFDKVGASLCFSHDSNWLISGFWDSRTLQDDLPRTIKVWDMNNGQLIMDLDPGINSYSVVRNIEGISLSLDDKNIAFIKQSEYGKEATLVVEPFLPVSLCSELHKLPLQSIGLLWYCLVRDASDEPIEFLKEMLPYFYALPKELRDYFIRRYNVRNARAFIVESVELEKTLVLREKGKELEGAGKGKKRQRTEETSTQRRRRYEPEPKHRLGKKKRE